MTTNKHIRSNTQHNSTNSSSSGSPVKVLLVDDEPALSRIVKLSLEKLGGFEVTLIIDPLIAVQTAVACQPDIALLDVMMPHKNGMQVARSLRQTPGFEQLPMVFLSASVMRRGGNYWLNTDEGMYKRVEDDILRSCTLLEKPVMLKQLIAALDAALHKRLSITP
jgi:CheY-like chemotaxis protein